MTKNNNEWLKMTISDHHTWSLPKCKWANGMGGLVPTWKARPTGAPGSANNNFQCKLYSTQCNKSITIQLMQLNDLKCPWIGFNICISRQGTKTPQRAHQCQGVAGTGEADHRVLEDQHDVLCLKPSLVPSHALENLHHFLPMNCNLYHGVMFVCENFAKCPIGESIQCIMVSLESRHLCTATVI